MILQNHNLVVESELLAEIIPNGAPDDLRHTVLAEHIEIKRYPHLPNFAALVTFDFLCPNCGRRHWATENDNIRGLFSMVGWSLKCGTVTVRMPWAKTAERDKESVYHTVAQEAGV